MKTIKLVSLFYFQAQETFIGTVKIGQNNCFLKNHVFLPTKQAGTNIC